MKTLIVDIVDPKRIGELVTAAKVVGAMPDLLALGPGDVCGAFPKVFRIDNAIGANAVSELAGLVQQQAYEAVLFTATSVGASLAGPLAVRLSAPILTEVTGISPDGTFERPLYGGKAVSKYKATKLPIVATIRRKYFEAAALEGATSPVCLEGKDPRVRLVSEKRPTVEGVSLEDAEVIISGGRGMGSGDNFALLEALATFFKGAVGASRGAVDEGWAPPSRQIGQTGNIVAPSVYFAVGISGASQHLAGIANAKCVVAINKDEEANIFNRARFGVVCDYKKFIPALTKAIEGEQ